MSPNVLAQRLRELERAGMVRSSKLPPTGGFQGLRVTDWGMELEPVIVRLGRPLPVQVPGCYAGCRFPHPLCYGTPPP